MRRRPTVDRADLEKDVSSLLDRQAGTAPDQVSCPGDLTAKVGETMRCRVTRGSQDVPVEVRVASVDGHDVSYQIAPTLLHSTVEREVSAELERQVGVAPDDVSCPDDLIGRVGVKMRCMLSAGSDKVGLTVTVTAVQGKDVKFDIEVDKEKAS